MMSKIFKIKKQKTDDLKIEDQQQIIFNTNNNIFKLLYFIVVRI